MKINIFIYSLILLSNLIIAQNNIFNYGDSKTEITIREIPGKRFITFDTSVEIEKFSKELKSNNINIVQIENHTYLPSIIQYSKTNSGQINWAIIEGENEKMDNKNITYNSPLYIFNDDQEVGISHLFYVRLRTPSDINILEEYALKNNVEILGNNKYMPLWYTLACSNESTGISIDMVKFFQNSNAFEATCPDIMIENIEFCTNDTYIDDQWNLKNIGQPGDIDIVDINYCDAKTITTGNPNIIIAVQDNGIELDHPDLTNVAYSYDVLKDAPQTAIGGYHGTACAGIIGANSNNGLGISGIAPDSPIMSIHHSRTGYSLETNQRIADGINYAWQNNASVLSCSWGSDLLKELTNYTLIDNAISNALVNGRDGLGTIVVFAAGNTNDSVKYPASSNQDILAVGAVDRCGLRADTTSSLCDPWSGRNNQYGSCYGDELDVVAPGSSVPTTDLQGEEGENKSQSPYGDYLLDFDGTSAAAPHVAAVAGLILSINPSLTQKQVADIIEQTAQKVGGYNYQNTSGRLNGTWHNEVGYGLIDAYEAVLAARNTLPDCPKNVVLPDTTITEGSITIQASNTIENSTNYTINEGAEVNLGASKIKLKHGFHGKEGSVVRAEVDPCE